HSQVPFLQVCHFRLSQNRGSLHFSLSGKTGFVSTICLIAVVICWEAPGNGKTATLSVMASHPHVKNGDLVVAHTRESRRGRSGRQNFSLPPFSGLPGSTGTFLGKPSAPTGWDVAAVG